MAARKRTPVAPRPGGPTQSKDARRAAGRVRLDMWLSEAAARELDAIATREGWTRSRAVTELIATATQTWAHLYREMS